MKTNRIVITETMPDLEGISSLFFKDAWLTKEHDDSRPDEIWSADVDIKFNRRIDVDIEVEIEDTDCDLKDDLEDEETYLSDIANMIRNSRM